MSGRWPSGRSAAPTYCTEPPHLKGRPTLWLAAKYLITAALVVLISEIARLNDRLGGLIAALPVVTLLTLIWLYVEQQPMAKIANHARYIFWYGLPTLPMFLVFPWLLQRMNFWLALLLSAGLALASFLLFAQGMRRWGIELMP